MFADAADDLGITMSDFAHGEIVYVCPQTGARVRKLNIDDKSYALRWEIPYTQALLDANAEDRANQAGTGWGNGRMIGRIPINLIQDEAVGLHDAIRNYDGKFIAKFLEDNPALKTRDRI